jgi:hypothetical protein
VQRLVRDGVDTDSPVLSMRMALRSLSMQSRPCRAALHPLRDDCRDGYYAITNQLPSKPAPEACQFGHQNDTGAAKKVGQ